MRILFDNGTPKPIARSLAGHQAAFARQIGWHELKNGELLRMAIVVLRNQQWPDVRLHLDRIATAVNSATPGSFTEVAIPHK